MEIMVRNVLICTLTLNLASMIPIFMLYLFYFGRNIITIKMMCYSYGRNVTNMMIYSFDFTFKILSAPVFIHLIHINPH